MVTVLITGPTGGLGREATLALAARADLLLVGRPGEALAGVAAQARAAGATVHKIGCDLGRLAEVRAAAATARELVTSGAVRPLRAIIANAGMVSMDLRGATADGYERTFAINYLAHAQLVGDLVDTLTEPARVVLVGSNVYRGDLPRRMMGVPGPAWRDPLDLARPAVGARPTGVKAAGVAYADSKLAILYFAHELQRRVGDGIGVSVFEPGWMPGTGLGREAGAAMRALTPLLTRLPGTTTPERSGPALASLALDDRWAGLRDGAFVVVDKPTPVLPFAIDRDREHRLWQATAELLERARA